MTSLIHNKMHTLLRYKWKDHDGVTWETVQPASWVAEFMQTHEVYDIRTVPNTGKGCDDEACWCTDEKKYRHWYFGECAIEELQDMVLVFSDDEDDALFDEDAGIPKFSDDDEFDMCGEKHTKNEY